ncbi:hypothetical protein FORC88_1725 [Salmonella enterica subsp. enterica serovar Typhimurium]|nr:hypothetical protein FORC88_1725 [Salmonella enterica subsp. enterica serovar Typhimurium]
MEELWNTVGIILNGDPLCEALRNSHR